MANQNFRVKRGLEVGVGATFLYADDSGVGINSVAPRTNLDVRGRSYIDELVVGPGTSLVGVGSTYFKVDGDSLLDGDVRITGDLIFDDAIIDDLFVAGIATINELDFRTGYGDTLGVGILTANTLEVSGVSTFNEFVTIDAPLGVTSSIGVGGTLFVGGDVQIGGGITFKGDVTVEIDVEVIGNINQNPSGITTLGELNFGVGIGSTLTLEDLFVTGDIDVNGTGIATLGGDPEFNSLSVTGFSTFGGLNTTGFSTFYQNVRIEEDLEVGGDITLLDLDAGNITVGGTVTTNGLEFNTGIGTTAYIGFASITDLEVTGVSTFVGVSTFQSDVSIGGTLRVVGDLIVDDITYDHIEGNSLDISGISTMAVAGIDTLSFKVGIGSTLTLEDLFVTGDIDVNGTGIATIGGDPVFNSLSVTGFSTFGGLNTTGFSTFYQNVRVDGDLAVTGDIQLEDLESGNITVGGTVTTNGLNFNVGVGTSLQLEELVVTGISSLNIITGVGSELQYLPAGSISTSVGIGSTQPPEFRDTGEPIQPGDLWFDAAGLRQYTYFVGLNTLGEYEGIWLDSNPPPIQPDLTFAADTGLAGGISLPDDVFDIKGTSNQIITKTDPLVSGGNTITVGLTTNVNILGDLGVNGYVSGAGASITGVGTFGSLQASSATIDSVTIEDVTVDEITAGQIGVNTFTFNVGTGGTLGLSELNVSGIASLNGSNLVAQGDDVTFGFLQAGVTTLGLTTITSDLYVGGDLYIADDLQFDEATLRNITVSDQSNLNNLDFNVGIGTTLTIRENVSVGSTLDVAEGVTVGGGLTVTGISSFVDRIEVSNGINMNGDINGAGTINAVNIDASNQVTFDSASGTSVNSETLDVTGLSVLDRIGFTTANGSDVNVSSVLSVTGVGSFVGPLGFTNANGYDLTVERLTVPPGGFVDLPGIPVVGGAASFSQLNVTGLATFIGFTTFIGDVLVSGAMTVGSLEAGEINFSGGTGIGSDNIVTDRLNVTGLSTFVGLSTFQGDVFIADDLEVKRNLLVGGIATVGVLTAGNSVISNLIVTGDLAGGDGGTIIIDGGTAISGIVTIGDNSITLDGRQGREYIELGTGSGNRIAGINTITGERSYVSVDEGRFNNFISVAGVGSTSTFANDVIISGDLTIEGDVSFDGGTGIGSTAITTDDIEAETITVGFITATNAYAGIITAQDFNSLSDRRVKENIRPIEQPLDKVSRLNGVKYNFVNSNKPSVGVIAQEVEKVFPELIAGTFPKSVNYNGLTGLLIEAVKELKEQNEELKRRLDKLEG